MENTATNSPMFTVRSMNIGNVIEDILKDNLSRLPNTSEDSRYINAVRELFLTIPSEKIHEVFQKNWIGNLLEIGE